jgi:hypothetical protein
MVNPIQTGAFLRLSAKRHVLKLDPELLKAGYLDELEGGQIKANAKVAENLYRKATGDGREAVTAAIFWLKARARWKETAVHEHAASTQFTHDDFILQFSESHERANVPPARNGVATGHD